MLKPASLRERRLRMTKAQLIDEIETLEQRADAIEATYRSGAPMQAKASENAYAYFSLEALYGLPKPSLNIVNILFSNAPFGANISLDGVHPSSSGQAILATAAAQAIGAKYGIAIP